MTIDEAIAHVESLSSGRTRWDGHPGFFDELLVAEIKRLRAEVERLTAPVTGEIGEAEDRSRKRDERVK